MESAAVKRLWLLCLLLVAGARAELLPASSVMLPAVMPVPHAAPPPATQLRVAVPVQNSAPWSMRIGDRLWGIDADYLSALSQQSGLRFQLQGYPDRSAQLQALKRGEVDLVLTTESAPLPAGASLSASWFSTPLRIYRNRANQRAVMFNSDNAQLTIAGSTLTQLPPELAARHRWHPLAGNLQALYALLNQQSDYLVADEASAGFLLSQLQQGEIYQITADPDAVLTLRTIARDPALTTWIDAQLRLLPAEFSRQVAQRWSPPLPRYQDTQTLMLSPAEQQWLAAHPVVTYAAAPDNAPWSYRDASGNARGFGIDLLNALGQSTGIRFTPRWVANPQQAQALLAQQAVMLTLLEPLDTPDAASTTLPVWRAIWGVYSRMPLAPADWSSLQGKRLGVLRGDLARQLLPPGITPQWFDDRTRLWQALGSGQIDALVDNVISARWRLASRDDTALRLAFAASDIAWPMAPRVTPQQPQLRALLDRALQQIPPETLNQMRASWAQPPQPGSTMMMRSIPKLLLFAAALIIAGLLLLQLRHVLQQRRERRQRAEAERASAAKSQFLATVSHELRTPMQAILGLLELEQQQHVPSRVALMHSSARSLMALLNDLQDHARIENQSFRLNPHPLNLSRWLQQQRQLYHPLMRPGGPQLRVTALTPLPASVLLDSDRLQQVINNLVANALKFTREGEISLTLAAEEQITLVVTDSGSGIPLSEQAHLFEPWYQAPSGRRHAVQGSGLGLFICREIVQRMGGTLQLSSAPGQGTRVSVTLPLTPCDIADAGDDPVWPRYPQLRVAIVDDHPANLLVLQQQLAAFGIQAETFDAGRALLLADARQPFDVLFIDQMMPHPDGLTLLRILRRRQRQRPHPALRVICSADVQRLRLPLQAHEAQLVKPVTLQALAALLAQAQSDPLAQLPATLQQLAQHDASWLPRISETLQRAVTQDRDALLQASGQRDWAAIEKAAHRLKGSWLMLGIEDAAGACQQLIDAAKQQQLHPDTLNLLILLTNRLLNQLERYGTLSLSQ
ncbi:ATP-binding protein [Pantoea eucrina]|uniref:hybrid sensor histidine kinase/response regulator n=1 Tax=Pantoea eucrina TaxID=472693 RepID=UPI002025EC77|nr:transporter substrate-binding domain-containing protein [Pantoea eucrina]